MNPEESDLGDAAGYARHQWIEEILVKVREGNATDAEVEKLQGALVNDREARRVYLRHNQLSSLLESVAWSEQDDAGEVIEISSGSSFRKVAPWILGLCAAFTLGLFMPGIWRAWNDDQGAELGESENGKVLGSFSVTDEAAVTGSGAIAGNKVQPGEFSLSGGIAELKFDNGVEIILEGACRFEVIDGSVVKLHHGKIRARCPFEARGFQVKMAGGNRIVDLGAEFGVVLTDEGKLDLHVFDGSVEFEDRAAGKTRTVGAGRALFVMPDGGLASRESDPDSFATSVMLQSQRWDGYRRTILEREDLLLYYDFSDVDSASGVVKNRVGDSAHGALTGATPVAGRVPGQKGLLFQKPGDAVAFDLDLPTDLEGLTIGMWVKLDRRNRTLAPFLMSNGWTEGDIHFQFSSYGSLRCGVHSLKAFETRSNVISVDEWSFVVVSWDFTRKQASFYCNGERYASLPYSNGLTDQDAVPNLGKAQIGSWGDSDSGTGYAKRFLEGRIDEVMVFSRALEEGEIESIYRVGQE